MSKSLPPRPNLDHLRRQAKDLLAALAAGEAQAVETFRQHLPAAEKLKPAEIRKAGFRLADAQAAVARQSGFANWPRLARHVEQLRALEGTWEFAKLEIDGQVMPPGYAATARLLINGDRFRTESPEATYEGIFNIDVEAEPHRISIEFVAGPEAGNWNYGIFRLDGDELTLCLDMQGKPHPAEFATSPGSGRAFEVLRRVSKDRPARVDGGQRTAAKPTAVAPTASAAEFAYTPSPLLTRLQGEWSAVKVVRDGQALPAMMLRTGLRSARENEIKISFGGQVMIHALVRLDETADPIAVDYLNQAGPTKGQVQHGIFKWDGEDACFCMAAAGQPRPTELESPAGAGRTLSQWRRKQ